jgi:hypothetical protein
MLQSITFKREQTITVLVDVPENFTESRKGFTSQLIEEIVDKAQGNWQPVAGSDWLAAREDASEIPAGNRYNSAVRLIESLKVIQ